MQGADMIPPTRVSEAAIDLPPERQSWDETLSNGEHVSIRQICKQDTELERDFLQRLSPRSRRFRFLETIVAPSAELLSQLVDIDLSRDVAFIALTVGKDPEQEIGAARLCADPDGQSGEFAVVVSDEWQRLGLGTRLMRHLMDSAGARGFVSMYSIDAGNNQQMRGFARHLGLGRRMDPDDPAQVIHTMTLVVAAGSVT